MNSRRLVRHLTAILAVIAVAVLLLTRVAAVSFVVAGSSMQPALEPGDRVVVELWSYARRAPRSGEIALLHDPQGVPLVKRVQREAPGGGFEVLGDNPLGSRDSRAFGPVPTRRFVGRVVWCYWPPSRFGPIR